MTHITVTFPPGAVALDARGHAEENGAACAAVSALLWALAGYLDAHGGGTGSVGKGEAALRAERGTPAEIAAQCVLLGLLQVAKAAPEAVAVEVREAQHHFVRKEQPHV